VLYLDKGFLMANQNDKLNNNFNILKSELNKFKKELNLLNEQKEHWFSEKDRFGNDIREKIKAVKKAKETRDKLTNSVKENKTKRDVYDKDLGELKKKLDKLRKERAEIYTKHNLKGTPQELRKKIDIMDMKIEVEVISFDKEKKLMKEIKMYRSKLKEFDVAEVINKENTSLSREFDEKRKESSRLARLVRQQAAESQVAHNEMVAISKEIDGLRIQEDDCFKKFNELKEQYNKLNKQLKSKYDEINSIRDTIEHKKTKKKKEKKEKEIQTLDKMKEEVDKKLKKGKKLTTEDLKVFQDSVE